MSPAASHKPKWRRRAESRPDEILEAALEIFERDGFDAARVEDIARDANISKAGVYLYFETKEAILRGLIEREVAPLARNFKAMAEAGVSDPEGSLRRLLAAFTELAADKRKFAVPRLVLAVAGRYPDLAAFYRENVVDQALGAIRALIEAGIEKGVFRPCDAGAAARAVLGPMFIYGFYTHFLQGDPGPLGSAERVKAHTDLLLNGLAAPQ